MVKENKNDLIEQPPLSSSNSAQNQGVKECVVSIYPSRFSRNGRTPGGRRLRTPSTPSAAATSTRCSNTYLLRPQPPSIPLAARVEAAATGTERPGSTGVRRGPGPAAITRCTSAGPGRGRYTSGARGLEGEEEGPSCKTSCKTWEQSYRQFCNGFNDE